MRVDEARAEQLLTLLSVQDLLHARVTEAGELVFAAADAPVHVRIGQPPIAEEPNPDLEEPAAVQQQQARK